MIESQTLDPEILNVTENVTFTPLEWKYFVLELKDMMAEGKFDLQKVIHNARCFAELERVTFDNDNDGFAAAVDKLFKE